MLRANVIIRKSASENSVTVKEPGKSTTIDMSKLDRPDRNKVRRMVVGFFEQDALLRRKIDGLVTAARATNEVLA